MPAQQRHGPGVAAPSVVFNTANTAAASAGLSPASIDAGQLSVPCPLHGTRASPNGGGGPAPCHHDCPFCPCPCCPHVDAAMAILPPETARAAYAPPLSAFAAPPALLGSRARFAVFAGQPRAPPILI
jgi:hypothetical protein